MWYEIFKFEILYRAKRLDTYLFFAVLFLFSIAAFNFIFEGESIGLVKENAPFITARVMALSSGIFMVITSMIMGVPILRDFEYGMESLLFVNPISKRDYLLGRFLGSFVVLIFVFSGLIWGMTIGEWMPWRAEENLLPFDFWSYLKPFLTLVLPNLFFAGSLFFVSGTLSRNLVVVYTQGILFLGLFILSGNIENPMLSAILEPFSDTALKQLVASWSLVERNTLLVPVEGPLLYNRLFWIVVGILVLALGYTAFNFNVIQDTPFKKRLKKTNKVHQFPQVISPIPEVVLQEGFKANCSQLKAHALFYFQSIFKEVSFWSIIISGMAIILVNSINLGAIYGVDSYPTTYLIVEELQETSIFFFLLILVFYSGELIWKERGAQFAGIVDALPVSDFIHLAGKFLGLMAIFIVLLLALIFSGVLFQVANDYYHFEPSVYFTGFFLEVFPFLLLYTFVSFFLQVLANSKYIGHLLVVVFFCIMTALDLMGYGHVLSNFAGGSLGKYSDMNAYGHFLKPYLWFNIYWLAFSIFLFVVTAVFSIRGRETAWKTRWKLSRQRWSTSLLKLGIGALLVFLLTGNYIFYNTNVLNEYWSNSRKLAYKAEYEKTLKQWEQVPLPKLVKVYLNVELFPKDRDYTVEGHYIFTNTHAEPIGAIPIQKWIDAQIVLDYIELEGGATVDSTYQRFDYYNYQLNQALQPGDSIKLSFKQSFTTKGFVAKNSSVRIAHNGTFLDNQHLPMLGYNKKFEIRDEQDRKKYNLAPRISMAKRAEQEEDSRYGVDDYEISFEAIIGTDSSQIAIAPGYLLEESLRGDRRYFHYKMDQPMMNLYSINSARYEVVKDAWIPLADTLTQPVALEIYYHKGHEYNLHRMMESMKKSLDYYSENFSPYQYEQMRIVEFPRYIEFAQSFPNMIPFSEALGFILDIDDQQDVDIAFFVTAHEMAHQWWGHQLTVSKVQGWALIIESLAQYAALMVLKENYPQEKVQQFLQLEMDRYLKKRMTDDQEELPLDLVEKQEYIYYEKGLINMYALQDYIGEDQVNLALRQFIADWNVTDGPRKKERYPTSADLLDYFSAQTPDSLQYIIEDLFESITLYENKTTEATYTKISANQYKINLTLEAQKYRVDSLGIESAIAIEDWIDIGVYGLDANGKEELIYLKKHQISKAKEQLEIRINRLPTSAGIDPLHKLMDKERTDNVMVLLEGGVLNVEY